jgi:hypothetical protein
MPKILGNNYFDVAGDNIFIMSKQILMDDQPCEKLTLVRLRTSKLAA